MPMRQDCKYFESRSYPNGDTVRKCDLDLAPEAPWRCPDDCPKYTRRMADVNWSYGSLVTPKTPPEPVSVGSDPSVGDLLDAAEDIVNAAAPEVIADIEAERRKRRRWRFSKKRLRSKGFKRRKGSRNSGRSKGSKGPKGGGQRGKSSGGKKRGDNSGGLGERFRRRFRDGG